MAKNKTSKSTEIDAEDVADEAAAQEALEEALRDEDDVQPDAADKPEEPSAPEVIDPDSETHEPSDASADEDAASPENKDPEPATNSGPAPQQTESAFLPMALGGVAAGAIGFAAAFFGLAQKPDPQTSTLAQKMEQVEASVAEQGIAVGGLVDQVETLGTTDMSAIEAPLAEVQASVSALVTRLETTETTLNTIDTRLTSLEKRPITEGASEEAIAAYEQELAAAAADIAQQRAELEALISNALDTENAAEQASNAAMRRAGISRMLSALESGTPFDGAVADLQATGVDVPQVLADVAARGVTPITELQQAFPDAARAALAIARATTEPDAEASGFTSFLRTQLGARSLEPREGTDPDAVLSRAEAAAREGRLSDALAEIDTLPTEAKSELSAWSDQATERLDALRAAQQLSEELK